MPKQKIFSSKYLGWLIVPLFLAIWQLIAILIDKTRIFPPLEAIFDAFIYFFTSENEDIFADILASIRRAFVGFIIGGGLGLVVGLLTGRIRFFSNTLGRLVQLFRPITPVALVSLAVLWFGIGEQSKYFLIAWGVFFAVWISVHIGVKRVEQRYIWAAKSLGASSLQMVWNVYLKAALPVILSGLRTGISIAFILVFVAELAGASEGLGYRVAISYQTGRPDRVLAALIMLGGLGAAADTIFDHTIRKLFPWSLNIFKSN